MNKLIKKTLIVSIAFIGLLAAWPALGGFVSTYGDDGGGAGWSWYASIFNGGSQAFTTVTYNNPGNVMSLTYADWGNFSGWTLVDSGVEMDDYYISGNYWLSYYSEVYCEMSGTGANDWGYSGAVQ